MLAYATVLHVRLIVHVCTRKQRDFYKKGSLKRKKITRSTCMYLLLRTFGI